MACRAYGRCQSLQYVKSLCDLSRLGITLADVNKCCEDVGFRTVVVKGKAAQLDKAPLPAILHWNNSHFVVLADIVFDRQGNRTYVIADPAYGKVKCDQEVFEKNWHGEDGEGAAVVMTPSEKFDEIPEHRERQDYTVARQLAAKFSRNKAKIAGAVALTLLAAGCNWVMPVIYQKVIDNGVLAGNISMVGKLFLTQLAFFIGYMISSNFSSIVLMKLNFRIGVEHLSELMAKIIRLPVKYFDTRLNTDFMQRLDDQSRLQTFLSYRMIETSLDIVNLIVFACLLAYYNSTALWVFMALSAAAFGWNLHYLRDRKYIDYASFAERADNRNIVNELIYGMPEIKINNAQKTQIGRWRKNLDRINLLTLRSYMLNYKQLIGTSLINNIKDMAIIMMCAYFVIKGEMTLGVLMSVSYVLGQLSGPVSRLQSTIQDAQDAKMSMDRLGEIESKEEETTEGQRKNFMFDRAITFDRVDFKYPGRFCPKIFNGLSLQIKKGHTTAIVGNSGSGKTTLVKLLLGFYAPTGGSVKIDDAGLQTLDIEEWRQRCGAVMQDGCIFSGTIAENIAFGAEEIDYDRVAECARTACIADFAERLPGKYKMKIGKSGLELSNGQKQRILIARAIYKNPELLIFDEATSSLDTVNERRIMDNLRIFFKKRTVVIVAHRLSTVVNADNIIYLEDGKIVEQGTHKELVALHGKYYELIRNQLEIDR